MRRALATGLLGALMSLVGCGGKSSYDPWAGDRKTLDPPPKPPNCPHLPELANVTRPDGKIVDVRIIQVDQIKLYVPRKWLGSNLEFGDEFAAKHPTTGSMLGVYDPDLNNVECPGVVHKFVSKRNFFDLYFRFVVRRANAEPWILPNFSLETKVDNLSIRRLWGFNDPKYATPGMFEEKIFDSPPASSSAYIFVVPKQLVAIYPWPKTKPVGSREWNRARADVINLVAWLRTSPTKRDNDRIFKLGVAK